MQSRNDAMIRGHKLVLLGVVWLAPWSGCAPLTMGPNSQQAAALQFTAQPSSTPVSAAIAPAVVVQALDAEGRGVAGVAMTISMGTNGAENGGVPAKAQGVLRGTLTETTDAHGEATFGDLRIDWLGTGYTLVAAASTASGMISATSAAFNETRVGDACLAPVPVASCADSDGDGLLDAWELAGGIDFNGDGAITDSYHDLLLPGANAGRPDIYVAYDWMDYGPLETACNVDSDCSILAGLKGSSCTGPALAEGFRATCVASCTQDADCTALGPVHALDLCGLADGLQQCMHSHDPALLVPNGSGGSAALDAVAAAFARHGIQLHVIRGQALPHSHVVSFHVLNDPQIPANSISNSCEGGSLASGTAGRGKYAESFYDLKSSSRDPKANLAYHYAIFGHYSGCDIGAHCSLCPVSYNPDGTQKSSPPRLGQSGQAEVYGNDLIVSLAGFTNEVGNPPNRFNVGGTFMHELGHNFGLYHGGGGGTNSDGVGDNFAYKPNYLSVMNYNYQFVGIPVGAGVGDNHQMACVRDSDCPADSLCSQNGSAGVCSRLDYSTQVLPTGMATPGVLNENGALDESAGLGSGNGSMFFFTDGLCAFQVAATDGPVDWDGDGFAGDNSAATADLSPEDHLDLPCGLVTNLLFQGHKDWGSAPGQSIFVYAFQGTSLAKDGAAAPTGNSVARPHRQIAQDELSAEMAERAHVLYPRAAARIAVHPGCKLPGKLLAPGLAGTFRVALFGTRELDVAEVDVSSLRFQGAPAVMASITDVDGDGRPDLLVTFDMARVVLHPRAEVARLTGWLKNSQAFVGEADASTVRYMNPQSDQCEAGGKQ